MPRHILIHGWKKQRWLGIRSKVAGWSLSGFTSCQTSIDIWLHLPHTTDTPFIPLFSNGKNYYSLCAFVNKGPKKAHLMCGASSWSQLLSSSLGVILRQPNIGLVPIARTQYLQSLYNLTSSNLYLSLDKDQIFDRFVT